MKSYHFVESRKLYFSLLLTSSSQIIDKIISKLQEAGFMISCQKDSTLTRDLAEQIYKSKVGSYGNKH